VAWGAHENGFFAAHVAYLVKWLSLWGLWAPDLNATNFLLSSDGKPNGKMVALDWDKASWTARTRLMEDYLGRLERSVRKLNAPSALMGALRAHALGGT
jgi:hypothetical protein